MSSLLETYREYVKLKREELADDYAEKIDNEAKAYENKSKRIQKLNEFLELTNKKQNGKVLTNEEQASYEHNNFNGSRKTTDQLKEELLKMEEDVQSSLENIRDTVITTMSSKDAWFDLSGNEQNAIREMISSSDAETALNIYDQLKTKGQNYIKTVLKMSDTQDILNKNLKETSNINIAPKGLTDQIAEVNKLSSGFEQLDKIYNDVKDKDSFDFGNLADKTFVETFSSMGDSYNKFVETVSKSPKDLKACQSAFNDLVTDWISSQGVLNGVSEETRGVTIAMLENMGVSNASELVDRKLAVAKAQVRYETENLSNATDTQISKFIDEANAGDITAQALLEVHLKEQLLANDMSLLNMSDSKISALLSIAKAANITSVSLARAASAQKTIKESNGMLSPGALNSLTDQAASVDVSDFEIEFTPVNYTGGYKSNKPSSSKEKKGKEEDAWLEEFNKLYAELQHKLKMELITEQEYYDRLLTLNNKYFSNRAKYIEQDRKNLEELFSLQRSITQDFVKNQEHQITLLSKKDGTEQEQISIYRSLQNKVHSVANEARKYGLKENSDYIQELQTQWYDFQDKINSINKTIFDSRMELSENYIEDNNFYNTWGNDSEVKAWKRVLELPKEYYQKGIIDAEEYANRVREINKKLYSAIRDEIQKTLEDQIKLYETEKSNRDSTISAVVAVIDKEIEALNEKKEALQKVNDEKNRELELEKLKDALDNARRNKNMRVYDEDKGWIWEADKTAIIQAQQALDDFNTESQILEIEKEIEAWEEYKEQWSSIPDIWQKEQDRLQAEQLIGANWEADILNKRLETVQSFATKYTALLQSIYDAQQKLNDLDNLTPNEIYNYNGSSNNSSTSGSKKFINVADYGGKTPSGLSVGTLVQTGGGTYEIKGINADGSYQSEKVFNADGSYYKHTSGGSSSSSGSGSSSSNSSSGSSSSSSSNNKPNSAGSTAGSVIGSVTGGVGGAIGSAIGSIISSITKKKYATGGVNDFTGLAQLDGSPTRAETIFNASDSKKLWDFIHNTDNLAQAIVSKQLSGVSGNFISKITTSQTESVQDNGVHIDKLIIEQVSDFNDFMSKASMISKNR